MGPDSSARRRSRPRFHGNRRRNTLFSGRSFSMSTVAAGNGTILMNGPQQIPVEHDPFAEGELTAALSPTAPQHELWIASKVGGDDANRAFNECLSLRLRGALNAEVLARAV